jgi:hypothetical protein
VVILATHAKLESASGKIFASRSLNMLMKKVFILHRKPVSSIVRNIVCQDFRSANLDFPLASSGPATRQLVKMGS